MDSDKKWERWIREALQGRRLHEPPDGVLRRAMALGGQLPQRPEGGLRWLVELLFDSSAQPLPAGVRSAASSQRRLLYQVQSATGGPDSGQLDLRVRREPGGTLEVTGQLMPPWSGGRVAARAARTRRKQALGQAGEFLLRGFPGRAESLHLEIHGEAGESLIIEDVPLLPPSQANP